MTVVDFPRKKIETNASFILLFDLEMGVEYCSILVLSKVYSEVMKIVRFWFENITPRDGYYLVKNKTI